MKTLFSLPAVVVLFALLPTLCCAPRETAPQAEPTSLANRAAPASAAGDPPTRPADPALEPYRQELLQLAFRAASAFPLQPHRKNRSRSQEKVVTTCFELGQPRLAVALARNIEGWRRGSAYADYANLCAKRGDAKSTSEYIALAEQVADEQADAADAQEWRSDLIRLKVARAYASLGDRERAAKAVAKLDAASSHAVDEDWAQTAADHVRTLTREAVDAELAAIDASFGQMSLGQQQVAMTTLVGVHERFGDDETLCSAIEARFVETWVRLPPALRLEALRKVAESDFRHGRQEAALRLLGQARELAVTHTWRAEDAVPQLASLAAARCRIGERDQARADLEAAVAVYHKQREQIVDIYRAGTVRSLALAYEDMGCASTAHDLCTLAIEEGMTNPNSRPRAEDLVETCAAMAVHGIEPSKDLWERLRHICEGLGNPW
ncbi:MAG: hypothetical protein ABIP94_13455 [Planctomycetota bacterium]